MMPRGWLPGLSLPAPAPASQGQRVLLPAITCPPPAQKKIAQCPDGGGSIPGARRSWESHFPPGRAGVSPLGGQSCLRQEARLHGLSFGSVGSDFQAEFLDENKKGGKKINNQAPILPLTLPQGAGCCFPRASSPPSALVQPRKASSPPPACRTPNNLETLLAGQVSPPLPRVPGSAGHWLCTAPTRIPGVPPGRSPLCHQRCHEVGPTRAGLSHAMLASIHVRPRRCEGSLRSNRELELHFQLHSLLFFFSLHIPSRKVSPPSIFFISLF